MKYEVIDNALPKESAEYIKNVLTSNMFPWFYEKKVTNHGNNLNLNEYYFSHSFYKNYSWSSEHAQNLLDPIISVLEPTALIRIKGNFYPRTENELQNQDHADYPFSHRGAIYYVNSNDGHTILQDGTKIESVENRILTFDPSLMHRSTHCTDLHGRINIVFNYF